MLAAAIIAVVAAPMLWLIHAQDTGHISWVQPPSWLELYHLGAYLAAASGKAVGGVLLALNLVLIGFFVRARPEEHGAMLICAGNTCWWPAWSQLRSSSRCWCQSCDRRSITAFSSSVCRDGY